jgi:phosphoglycerol transferase MdoB-like AlkP superfamily enzyme
MNRNAFQLFTSKTDARDRAEPGMGGHLAFVGLTTLALMAMHTLLRLALMFYNHEQAQATSVADLLEAFGNGFRFDLRLVVVACVPLLLALVSRRWMASRRWMLRWLIVFASVTLFLGVVELDFYREFNQRLNGLVFQYMKEDPKTVLSMIWYGFPVVRYLLAWAFATWLIYKLFLGIDRITRSRSGSVPADWRVRIPVMLLCLAVAAVAGRGTLRQGSPLRWGDAFTTESMFANQLGLNGTLSLVSAATAEMSSHRDNIWKATLPQPEATDIVRKMLLTRQDTLVDADSAAVRRDFDPPAGKTLPIRNVVFILMESFSGLHIGAMGATSNITPYFDKLTEEGVLFTRFFSNGTHTHQGMFASYGCFPNLPGFEYLMKQPESNNDFSGLSRLLGPRGYDNLYVYNGDFAWDNQSGFFGKQGVTNYIGRMDFVNPVVFDPTWGVSDQDMFDRAAEELAKRPADKPFYFMVQTLSNHTPYPIPEKLPVERVTGHGALDEHLTAMRYADWALGQFFEKVRKQPHYKDTLFVLVGDHGFASGEQITEVNLSRFNVPLLLIGPGIKEKFGNRRDTVGTQVDIVPTIMGRLGGKTRHQCWGRDLLDLPEGDPGFGIIKPSGSDQTVAMLRDNRILVQSKNADVRLYEYRLGPKPTAILVDDKSMADDMKQKLGAFLQTATRSLRDNTTGPVAK